MPPHHGSGHRSYRHHFIDKPTQHAAVSGAGALDDGAEPALASDLVVADEHTNSVLPEVKRGLIAAEVHR